MDRGRRPFGLAVALVLLLAALVRVVYVLGAQVDLPIRGDVNQYVLYAWNLTHRGVFSSALPSAAGIPDSYRGPGYPLFLALAMWLAGHSDLPLRESPQGVVLGYVTDTWMQYALAAQVFLGTATVLVSIVLARLWLARAAALAAGLLVALWPHLITFSGTLLSETLFCFTGVVSLYLCALAEFRRRPGIAAGAGLSFGFAYLVNPLIGLLPLLLSAVLWLRGQRRLAIALLAAFAIAPGIWAIRCATVTGASGSTERVALNFVVGSIPQYFTAYNSRFDNAISKQIVDFASTEAGLLVADPIAGAAEIAERMGQDPGFYAAWYLWHKPYLLWDWAIRIGSGDIYFLETGRSPFERLAALRLIKSAAEVLNPLLFVLALVAALRTTWCTVRRSPVEFPMVVLTVFFVYVTVVHVVLQAEPRYSIAYRPEQILLALGAVAGVWDWWRKRIESPAAARDATAT